MPSIILTWNPDRWNRWKPSYPDAVELVAETGRFVDQWSIGRHLTISAGTEAWLLVQGSHGCGLIGHATVASAPYSGPRCSDAGRSDAGRRPLYIDVSFDALLPWGEQLPPDLLRERVPGVPWSAVRDSGTPIPGGAEPGLRILWAEYAAPSDADPTAPVPGTFPEDAVAMVTANRYERNPQARKACLDQHGTNCAACGFSFSAVFGEIGRDFIHVHHVVPVSRMVPGYELDPLTDLVPLCPNCHAMAHQRAPVPYTPAELRQIMSRSSFLAGDVVTAEQQQAQDEAVRILGVRQQALAASPAEWFKGPNGSVGL